MAAESAHGSAAADVPLDVEMREHQDMLDALSQRFVGREEDKMIIFRFARGYGWDLELATKCLEATLAWKQSVGIDAAFKERVAKASQWELTNSDLIHSYYPLTYVLG